MDTQLKAKWVEALRSGKYHQTQGTLRDGDGFCCLGVLCDLTQRGEWLPYDSENRSKLMRYRLNSGFSALKYFPDPLTSALSMDHIDFNPLMDMNDKGAPFSVIADYIEANL